MKESLNGVGSLLCSDADEEQEEGAQCPADKTERINEPCINREVPKKDLERWRWRERESLMMAKAPINPRRQLAAKRVAPNKTHWTMV